MTLDGYKQIAAHIARAVGEFSERSVQRYARRARDPLPVMRFGRRVLADHAKVDAWVRRQFRPVAPPVH